MSKKVTKVWLTADELADIVGRDVMTVYTWIRLGLIPSIDERRTGSRKPRYRVHVDDAKRAAARIASGLTVGT